jgi:UDP-N-acetylglucosamine 2-epimerase (non-hydrolysing)
MRDTTERPETVAAGANRLVSADPDRIAAGAAEMLPRAGGWANPFGDGNAAERILRALPLAAGSREALR